MNTLSLVSLYCLWLAGCTTNPGFALPTTQEPTSKALELRPRELSPNWAIEIGADLISTNQAHRALIGTFDRPNGDAEGQIYKLTVTPTLYEFDWEIAGGSFHPRLEFPVSFYWVDERGRHPFMAYSAALGFRWVDFPWNDTVYTTLAIGTGNFYSNHILQVDRDENDPPRSHVKFAGPVQITLSHPSHKNVQLALYSDHFSGGSGVFDVNGFDAFGFGIRFTF